MATLLRVPLFFTSSVHNDVSLIPKRLNLCYLSDGHRRFTVCCATTIKEPRVRKKVKSNEELRTEIMEFVSNSGFPEGHVPSTKELSERGRNDLANIVRRRGYKFIKDLLANSDTTDIDQAVEIKIAEGGDATGREGCLTGQDGTGDSLAGYQSSTIEAFVVASDENACPKSEDNVSVEQCEGGALTSESDKTKIEVENDHFSVEGSALTSRNRSQEKCSVLQDISMPANVPVSEHGSSQDINTRNHANMPLDFTPSYLANVPVSEHYTSPDFSAQNNVNAPGNSSSALTLVDGTPDILLNQTQQIKELSKNDNACADSSTNLSITEKAARFIQNGKLDTVEETPDDSKIQPTMAEQEVLEDSCYGKKTAGMTSNGSTSALVGVPHVATENGSHRDTTDVGKDPYVETLRRQNQVEINRLKFLLHQKELELSRLKEQIEKEKLALSVLEKKAETEINKAQKLISEKDAELHAAEESLSGLEEVEIQFCCTGELVEVTGSFNGWQHRIEMEPKPTTIIESADSRELRCWSTSLWLYPGTYEIKFIVDGQWRLDPQKESVTRGHITNNILRVSGRAV